MESQLLAEQKDIDYQVSKVSVGPHSLPPNQHDVKLKELLEHLEYVLLEEGSKLPVIISLILKEAQKERLVTMLHKHKKAIASSILDIKGIIPFFCKHKILMEGNTRPRVQPQRRLNPNMLEVVKKEAKKLLDA